MVSVVFLELAQNEVGDIFESYEYKQKNLGYHFIQELKYTLTLITSNTDVWSKSSFHTKRCLIKGFPNGVLYQKVNDTIFVVAIVNLLKKPTHLVSKSTTACRISHLPETIYIR